MKYSDLLRSVSGYNGMSEKGRSIEIKQHDEGSISYRETPDKLIVTMPTVHDREVPEDKATAIRAKLAEVVGSFLYSSGIHSTIDEWKCDDSPLGSVVRDVDAVRSTNQLTHNLKGVKADVRNNVSSELQEFSANVAKLGPDLNDEGKSTLAALTTTMLGKAVANDSPGREVDALIKSLPDDVADKVREGMDAGLLNKIVDAHSKEESVDAGKAVFDYFFDRSSEEEIQQQQQKSEQGDGDEGDEDSESGQGSEEVMEALGKGRDEGKESEDQGEGKPDDSDTFSIGTDGHGTYYITPPDDVVYYDYSDPKHKGKRERNYLKESVLKNNAALFAKVRRLLQVRSEAVYEGGLRRGKLQRSKVYRIGCPTVGNGDWNSRIFRKRTDSETLDTCVEVLIDFSGSMHGDKIETAITAGVQLADCLDKVGIPVCVTAFSDYYTHGDNLITGVFKNFDAPCNPQDMLDAMSYHEEHFMASNPDCCAVHYAIQRVGSRREKRKVLLVLSDGHPAAMRRSHGGSS